MITVNAPATAYYVLECKYAIRADSHWMGTPMLILNLTQPDENGVLPPGRLLGTLNGRETAQLALTILGDQFRRCGVGHNDPYPACGAWASVSGPGARGADLYALVDALQDTGFYVAIDTVPLARNHLGAGIDWVCISPNLDGENVLDADPEAMGEADEVRFLIRRPHDVDYALGFLGSYPAAEGRARVVSVQGTSIEAQRLCASQALAWGWRTSLMPLPEPPKSPILHAQAIPASMRQPDLEKRNGRLPK